jgi:hypothetical protein
LKLEWDEQYGKRGVAGEKTWKDPPVCGNAHGYGRDEKSTYHESACRHKPPPPL